MKSTIYQTITQKSQLPLTIVYYKNSNLTKTQNLDETFSKSKIQAYCKADGSIIIFSYYMNISSNNSASDCTNCYISSILYFSPNGIKHKINIKDVKHCEELAQKLKKIFNVLNEYNDEYLLFQEFELQRKLEKQIEIDKQKEKMSNENFIYKKFKIKEFTWENSIITKTQICEQQQSFTDNKNQQYYGYQIKSDDLNATLILLDDLYQVKVSYLQLWDQKQNKIQVSNGKSKVNYGKIKINNFKLNKQNSNNAIQQNFENNDNQDQQDNPLSKYAFYPPKEVQNKINQTFGKRSLNQQKQYQISYKYKKVNKTFTIFNIPSKWYQPIRLVWSYLLKNKTIKGEFLYIDFEQNQIKVQKLTRMMKTIKLLDVSYSKQLNQSYEISLSDLTNENILSILGKPKNMEPFCQWIYQQYYLDEIRTTLNINPKQKYKSIKQNQNLNQNQKILQNNLNDGKSLLKFFGWLNHQSDMNILYDGYGYWHKSKQSSYIYYKKKNCQEAKDQIKCQYSDTQRKQIKYHISSIPLVTRINSNQESKYKQFQPKIEPERRIKPVLQTFISYIDHNCKKQFTVSKENEDNPSNINRTQSDYLQISNDYPYTEQIQNIGTFKAYPNQIVIGKFVDKVIINMNGKRQLIEVVDQLGEKCQINLGIISENLSKNQLQLSNNSIYGNNRKYKTSPYSKFRQHIMYIKQFHQRVFYPLQWQNKKKLQQKVSDLIEKNKIFRKFTDKYSINLQSADCSRV